MFTLPPIHPGSGRFHYRLHFALFSIFIAVQSFADEPEIAYLGLDRENNWQVWTMTAKGKEVGQITDSALDKVRVSWHPDGNRLLVNAVDGFAYWVNLADHSEHRIETGLSGFQDAVLSPDGEHFTFSLSTSGSIDANNIWLAEKDGSDLKKITSLPWLQHEPAWGPNGDEIYFLSGSGGQTHDVWSVSVQNLETRQITANQVYHFDIAISPSGRLVYSNNREGYYNLWLRQHDGSERQLTSTEALDARPSWSPDERKLVFESSREGGLDIWLLDLDTGEVARLTHTRGGARFPVWFKGKN